MDDLINSYRLPSPKFDALHDMYIVLSSVQTNFEAILSYIYIYSRDLARSRAAEPWPRPQGLDWKLKGSSFKIGGGFVLSKLLPLERTHELRAVLPRPRLVTVGAAWRVGPFPAIRSVNHTDEQQKLHASDMLQEQDELRLSSKAEDNRSC
ncbi:hypothetical protein EMCRGX_G010552 [Ephydatia muelleri]